MRCNSTGIRFMGKRRVHLWEGKRKRWLFFCLRSREVQGWKERAPGRVGFGLLGNLPLSCNHNKKQRDMVQFAYSNATATQQKQGLQRIIHSDGELTKKKARTNNTSKQTPTVDGSNGRVPGLTSPWADNSSSASNSSALWNRHTHPFPNRFFFLFLIQKH